MPYIGYFLYVLGLGFSFELGFRLPCIGLLYLCLYELQLVIKRLVLFVLHHHCLL